MKTRRINGQKFVAITYRNPRPNGRRGETWYPVENLRWLAERMKEIGGTVRIGWM